MISRLFRKDLDRRSQEKEEVFRNRCFRDNSFKKIFQGQKQFPTSLRWPNFPLLLIRSYMEFSLRELASDYIISSSNYLFWEM